MFFFNLIRRNLANNVTDDFVSKCAYDTKRDPYCPTFTIEQIINQAEPGNISTLGTIDIVSP